MTTLASHDDRFDVISTDGTPIAVWVDGAGAPIVLVHGSFGDHTGWAGLTEHLSVTMTTFALDRRGFGASGDGAEYSIERDFEDVAVVVDAVATRTGSAVALVGHSYGANCSLGAAAMSDRVERLVLYEPSLGLQYPPGAIEAAEAALAAGDRESAVEHMLFDVLELTADEVAEMRSGPRWPKLIAGAHTAPRECRVEAAWEWRPDQFASIAAPTLFLTGNATPANVRAVTQCASAVVRGARVLTMDGHGHFAHRSDPARVCGFIMEFLAFPEAVGVPASR